MSRNGLLSLVGGCALALAAFQAQAQVSVNAPSALTNRSVTKKPAANATVKADDHAAKKEEPSARHQQSASAKPQQHHASEQQPSSHSSGTSSSSSRRRGSYADEGGYSSASAARPMKNTLAAHSTGYRIQAFTANNAQAAKANATKRAKAIAMRFPQYRAYITYKAPAWRLRIGDFTSQREAQEALRRMKSAFPNYAFTIVRDRISVWR